MFKYSAYHHAKTQMMKRLRNRKKELNLPECICNKEKVGKNIKMKVVPESDSHID